MTSTPLFSIIIPVRIKTKYLLETISFLKKQSFKSFEILVITDKISKTPNPSKKRNYGASIAKGKYLAFLDDDSYPDTNWLLNSKKQLESDSKIAAVCGPCLTPPTDNYRCQASGLVWSSILGSGGAGSYRNSIGEPRFVDDFPSVNLVVKRDVFENIGGFKTSHWPGEDTLLCLDIVYKYHKKIYYHPSIIVYHHRRQVIIDHLKQITRYALHRGNFARIYPQNSFKLGYFIPSIFLIYLISLPFFLFYFKSIIFLLPIFLYLVILFITFFSFILLKNFSTSLLATITIPLTHIYYGFLFIVGFLTPKLSFVPHHVDLKKGKYLGG